jgi:hypothetical protein
VATERLSRLEDGRLLYRLKHRWRDGTTHIVFEPQELLEKLIALVPPPRFHLVRYHGILGPSAGRRADVVPRQPPRAPPNDSEPRSGAEGERRVPLDEGAMTESRTLPDGSRRPARRLAWADLLRRVFAVDVLECPRCGGRMRLLATIHPPDATHSILECLGLPSRAPPVAPVQAAADLPGVGAVDVDAAVGV